MMNLTQFFHSLTCNINENRGRCSQVRTDIIVTGQYHKVELKEGRHGSQEGMSPQWQPPCFFHDRCTLILIYFVHIIVIICVIFFFFKTIKYISYNIAFCSKSFSTYLNNLLLHTHKHIFCVQASEMLKVCRSSFTSCLIYQEQVDE